MLSGGGGDDEGDGGCGLEGTKEECDFSLKSCGMFVSPDLWNVQTGEQEH